jgi:acetyl/propionyl-CoA carboxylase alpha subunit
MTKGITGSPEELLKNAGKIPMPILVKAAAGGGGKGMRIVTDKKDLEGVLETTSREAKNYFGDESIYIEKYIEEPRHIEFQVLGDNHGNVVHLFERECTIQRRYQKIIEESPSPTLTPEVREKMGEAAVAISREVGYNSAGTIEFLVDKDLNFYFLEMNTRIQVEHPVTEMVTGVDLIEEQIVIAEGVPLRLRQEELKQTGHAIECRIYAEDPANNFMPSPGKMTLYRQPSGENIRVDTGIDRATEIHSFFDPMIAKQVVWGDDRQIATEKSIAALKDYIVHGIHTNIGYLLGMLQHKAFSENKISTRFCDDHTDDVLQEIKRRKDEIDPAIPLLSFLLYSLNYHRKIDPRNTWEEIGYWRNIMEIPCGLEENDYTVLLNTARNGDYEFYVEDKPYRLELTDIEESHVKFIMDEHSFQAYVSVDEKGNGEVSMQGFDFDVSRKDLLNENDEFLDDSDGGGENNLFAPMPGKVIKVNVKAGDHVKRGTVLIVVEAMKMENNITADREAVVEKVTVREGEMVDTDVQLVFLEHVEN